MLKAHGITAVEKYTQPGIGMGLRRFDDYFVLLPFGRLDIEPGSGKLLTLTHRLGVDELYRYAAGAFGRFRPYGEAVFFAFEHPNTEIPLVHKSGAAVSVSRIRQRHVVRTTLKRSVVFQLYVTESLPAHETLRELKRAVFHQLSVKPAVGSIVDVFKKHAVHGVLHHCSHLFRIHIHHVRLCLASQRCRQQDGTCKHSIIH